MEGATPVPETPTPDAVDTIASIVRAIIDIIIALLQSIG